jgi:hypothetical protein
MSSCCDLFQLMITYKSPKEPSKRHEETRKKTFEVASCLFMSLHVSWCQLVVNGFLMDHIKAAEAFTMDQDRVGKIEKYLEILG